jgi:ParB family chromosome partitioning protein
MSSQLGQALGRKVNIVDGRKRGRIELEYYGADDREALLQALMTLKK